MHFRYSDKETAYEMSFDGKVEPLKINGVDAVMMDDRNLTGKPTACCTILYPTVWTGKRC